MWGTNIPALFVFSVVERKDLKPSGKTGRRLGRFCSVEEEEGTKNKKKTKRRKRRKGNSRN